ncbi:hypothetical protein [Fibrella forsythiae]|uniref:Uncharacterized protein n=1 Tax=Fibrella forsythiae TaxID=2817061 RepID=A0ABS3JRT8_9BACT|nr:hypothetical protein [Fibrella forsythiae]MBO0952168.1 hypothetical protein [Fibrella forsythiae]
MNPANFIEPGIRPLVEALNKTGLLETFSSCEGHFAPDEQQMRDRNHAEVRFVPAPGALPGTETTLEHWLGTLLARFKTRHGLMPVTVTGYKLFTPIDEETVEETYVIELRPFNRFDQPATRRADIDRAVRQLADLM